MVGAGGVSGMRLWPTGFSPLESPGAGLAAAGAGILDGAAAGQRPRRGADRRPDGRGFRASAPRAVPRSKVPTDRASFITSVHAELGIPRICSTRIRPRLIMQQGALLLKVPSPREANSPALRDPVTR